MPNAVRVAPRPPAGNTCSSTANRRINIRPSQKFGSEKPKIEPVMMRRPDNASGLRSAISPAGMPMRIEITNAVNASSSVAGMR
jgi:hypothetical protein